MSWGFWWTCGAEARLAVEGECPGWELTWSRDGTWKAKGPGKPLAARGIVRLRELMDGAEPTEDEAALAGLAVPS